MQISDRLGNVERKITFLDGSVFSTPDNDAIDQQFRKRHPFNRLLHSLESHMGWVVIALIFTVFSFFGLFRWGIPWASEQIALSLPHKTNELISSNTLDFLDKYFLSESRLDDTRKKRIRDRFETQLLPMAKGDDAIQYRIFFREWEEIPNAFALPSGDIILTDKFVDLAENQQEIDAILLHEMGHIVHRHTLQSIVSGTIVTTIVMMVAGDSNGLADMGIGVGSLLVSSKYSRAHEAEADRYAFDHMLQQGIDPQAFANIMDRITSYTKDLRNEKEIQDYNPQDEERAENLMDFFSSHPNTAERMDKAMQYSECFNAGKTTCELKNR